MKWQHYNHKIPILLGNNGSNSNERWITESNIFDLYSYYMGKNIKRKHTRNVICRWWQTFLVVLVVYSAWSSPFELAFRKMSTSALMPVDLVVDALFGIDIILTFFVAYLDKSTYLLVEDHNKIATRYVCTYI